MRIAQLTATFPPYRGGAGNVAFEYAVRLADRGHDVEVFTADAPGAAPDSRGAVVHRMKPVVAIGNAPLLPQLRRLDDFDVIHLHHPFIFGSEPALWAQARDRGRALVVTHHNRLIGQGARRPLFWGYEETVGRTLARRADHLCVLSRGHAQTVNYLARAMARTPDRVSVVPNGVDTDLFTPEGDDIRARFGIAPETPLALFAGGLARSHWFKRFDLMLEALARSSDQSLEVLVVGGGDLLERYQEQTTAMDLGGRVHFAGVQPHDAMPSFHRAADLLVLPSSALESFGIVLIEAMACGTPVVATRLPGVAEVVRDGETGLLAEPGDAPSLAGKVDELLAMGAEQRRAMGQAGRTDVLERFAWPSVIDRVEAAYEAALAR